MLNKHNVVLAALLLSVVLCYPVTVGAYAQVVENQTNETVITEQPAPQPQAQPPVIVSQPSPVGSEDIEEIVDEKVDEKLADRPSAGSVEGTVLAGVVSGVLLGSLVPYFLKLRAKEQEARKSSEPTSAETTSTSSTPDESSTPTGSEETIGRRTTKVFSEGDVEINFPFEKKYMATAVIGFFIALMLSLATWESVLDTAIGSVDAGRSLLTVYINSAINAFGVVGGINLALKRN